MPVFTAVRRKYGTPRRLADADPDSLAKDLKSLGLYWRIAQFKQLAIDLIENFGGHVPNDRSSLMSLTGVSEYVADAVLAFAFGQPRAVVDANVARVLARHFGLREHAESRRDPAIRLLADELVNRRRPREYNFAMLDLAALICTARTPKHSVCPLRRTCVAAGAH